MTARRYVFVTIEGGGNLPPVLGAARRLVALGHDVRVLTEPCLRGAVEGVGARFVAFQRCFTRTSRSEEIFFDWEASSPPAALQRAMKNVVLGPAAALVADVGDELDREAADALVIDWLLPGGVMVGEARGIPTAVLFHCVSMLPAPGRPPGPLPPATGPLGRLRDAMVWGLFARLVRPFGPEYNRVRATLGLAPLANPLDQYRTARTQLLMTLREFDFAATEDAPNEVYTGPLLDDPDWIVARSWESPFAPDDRRPLVVLSLSTTFQNQKALLQTAIDALGDVDVRGLVTLGPAMGAETFHVPANVRLVPSAPHALVLPEAACFVTHCGHGSVMRSIAAGVPMVALPMGRDQDANATRIVRRGLGLRPRRTRRAIAQAVGRVLAERSFGEAVAAMQQRLKTELAQDRVTTELVALCRP